MLQIFVKPMLGALFSCIYVFPIGAEEQTPTPAPTEAKKSAPQNDASAPPNAAQGNRTANTPQSDAGLAGGERRIARVPTYPESAWAPPAASSFPPLPLPADSRAQGLKHQADALATQGHLSKAVALYDEALRIAPRSAEIYRGRALALLRLGDRVQAQNDYRLFLDLDPQAQSRVQQEIQLFEQSVGESSALASGGGLREPSRYISTPPNSSSVSPREVSASQTEGLSYNPPTIQDWQPSPNYSFRNSMSDYLVVTANRLHATARNAFLDGNYDVAYHWTQRADVYLPQARTRALAAQILLAQGVYSAAAAEARAAVTMGPLIDSTTLYSYYDFNVARYRKQFQTLQDYVRENPSAAEARFLLGYQHRILNQKEAAHAQLAVATVLDPLDTVAKELLARDGVEVVGAKATATKNMMAREGVSGSVRVSRVPPPPAPPTAPTDEPIKR